MKKLLLSCQAATYLISLKEEGKLSFRRRMQLRAHIGVCSFCRLFETQTRLIGSNAKHSHEHISHVISNKKKEAISKRLDALMHGEADKM